MLRDNTDQDSLEILHADRSLVVVNKPPGLLIHRSAIAPDVRDNLVGRLRDQLGQKVYPVHRLDRPTSGVIVVALDADAQRHISEQFEKRLVRKSYLAIVRGYMEASGELNYPLTDRGSARSRDAVSRWIRLETGEIPRPVSRYQTARYSLVQLEPHTGRWHQLRRHCAHLRHPIIGDTSHGDRHHNRFFRDELHLRGLMLMAHSLRFQHPAKPDQLEISARPPDHFLSAMKAVGFVGGSAPQ